MYLIRSRPRWLSWMRRPGGLGFNPRPGRQHSFVEIDHEIFSTVILSLPLIQEGQLSVSGERMCTLLVNRLEDQACPVNVWLGKMTALDMTPLGWLGRKTSTQKLNKKIFLPFSILRSIFEIELKYTYTKFSLKLLSTGLSQVIDNLAILVSVTSEWYVKRVICKTWSRLSAGTLANSRPRSVDAQRGVWSGSALFALNTWS